jgi:hypothetical protein
MTGLCSIHRLLCSLAVESDGHVSL